jgi:hypothetical protein
LLERLKKASGESVFNAPKGGNNSSILQQRLNPPSLFCRDPFSRWGSLKAAGAAAVFKQLSKCDKFSLPHLINLFRIFQHHYSISGGASAVGLGTENCVKVKCDDK